MDTITPDNPCATPQANWGPPQVDYRSDPSAGGQDLSGIHPDLREHPEAGGQFTAPMADSSFHSYDTVGDAVGYDHMSQAQPIQVNPT